MCRLQASSSTLAPLTRFLPSATCTQTDAPKYTCRTERNENNCTNKCRSGETRNICGKRSREFETKRTIRFFPSVNDLPATQSSKYPTIGRRNAFISVFRATSMRRKKTIIYWERSRWRGPRVVLAKRKQCANRNKRHCFMRELTSFFSFAIFQPARRLFLHFLCALSVWAELISLASIFFFSLLTHDMPSFFFCDPTKGKHAVFLISQRPVCVSRYCAFYLPQHFNEIPLDFFFINYILNAGLVEYYYSHPGEEMSKLKCINLENGLNKCLFVAQIRNQDAKNRMAPKLMRF